VAKELSKPGRELDAQSRQGDVASVFDYPLAGLGNPSLKPEFDYFACVLDFLPEPAAPLA